LSWRPPRAPWLWRSTQEYLPWDRPGFGVNAPRATRPLPPDLLHVASVFYTWHEDYAPSEVPRVLLMRLKAISLDFWDGPSAALFVFALAGLVALTAEGWFALASFATLIACYLCYAHPSFYTVYYIEGEPALAFLTAVGVVRSLQTIARQGAPIVLTAVVALIVAWAIPTLREERLLDLIEIDYHRAVDSVFAQIHDPKAIVFVRYSAGHNPNMSLVHNVPDPSRAPLWVVYDRGADNARLLRIARDRVGYLFDEDAWTLTRLSNQ
jgi:hypothetical protein